MTSVETELPQESQEVRVPSQPRIPIGRARRTVALAIDFCIPTGTAAAGAALALREISTVWLRDSVIALCLFLAVAFILWNSVFHLRPGSASLGGTVAGAASGWRTGAAIVLVALIGIGVSAFVQSGGHDKASPGPDARIAVEVAEHAAQTLSYRAPTVESDVAQSKKLLTGGFLEYFSSYSGSSLIPEAKAQDLSVQWKVRASSLSKLDGDEAVVLAFLDGQIVAGGGADGQPMSSSVRLSAQRTAGAWLISDLVPV